MFSLRAKLDRLLRRTAFGATLLCPLAAAAQTEQVLVTATRLSGGIDAANAQVLDADAIAARQPASVVDLLRGLTDVYVQQSGGSVVSLFTRGAKPNFTLVLLDGVKANDPTNTRGGSYDFSTLDLNDIDRVEFVRGPASAIYGSDAVGGVLNIITRKGTPDFQAGLDAEGGSYGFWRAAGHVSGPIAGGAANLGMSYNDSGMPVEGSSEKGVSLDGSLTLPELAGVSLSLNGRYGDSQTTSFPDSSGGPLLSVYRTLDHRDVQEAVLGAHAARAISDIWNMALDYGLYSRASDAVSPGVAPSAQTPFGIPANNDDARFTRNQLTWTNRISLGAVDVAAGMDLQIEHGVDDGTLDFGFVLPTHFALDRTLWAGFAETRWQVMPALSLSASGRYDNGGGQNHFSPQLRGDYALAGWGTKFQLSWGEAYKLPSFYALGNPIVGDPTLKPERAATYDAGITQAIGDWGTWKLDGYDTHYSDLIDFQPGAVPKLVNLSRVHVRGVETSFALHWGAFSATPHVSYTNARNETSGAALRDVPSWLAGATLGWQADDRTNVTLDVSHVGAMIDNAVPTGDVMLASHVRADLALSYRVLPQITLHAAVDNLFDARYQSVVGFPAPGIVLRGGVTLTTDAR